MGFRENLLKKMEIDRLADQVRQSLAPVEGQQRIDSAAMRALLEMSSYRHHREGDLDLYCQEDEDGTPLILVLDNGLNLYRTTIADVVLRKSPTLKEMISIRNAIKILNDKDVLISRKADTLQRIQKELIDALDLAYTRDDIEAIAQDGREALKNNYPDGIIEVVTLFCELLGYQKAPKAFQLPHQHVWGAAQTVDGGQARMTPTILFSLMRNHLKMIETPIATLDKAGMAHFQKVAKGDAKPDFEGAAVLDALVEKVLN